MRALRLHSPHLTATFTPYRDVSTIPSSSTNGPVSRFAMLSKVCNILTIKKLTSAKANCYITYTSAIFSPPSPSRPKISSRHKSRRRRDVLTTHAHSSTSTKRHKTLHSLCIDTLQPFRFPDFSVLAPDRVLALHVMDTAHYHCAFFDQSGGRPVGSATGG